MPDDECYLDEVILQLNELDMMALEAKTVGGGRQAKTVVVVRSSSSSSISVLSGCWASTWTRASGRCSMLTLI